MEKRIYRRLAEHLLWTFVFAALPPVSAPAAARPAQGQARNPACWEVRLTVSVKGDYAMRGGGAPVSGEYTCRTRWEGWLEPDGEDFLLIHIKTEVLEWNLEEKAGPPGNVTCLEARGTPGPALRLNYVLKDGEDIGFDFGLEGITVPLHVSPVKIALKMPCSPGRGKGLSGLGYADFVRRGSNRVFLSAADFQRRTAERSFSWEWRREDRLVRDGRAVLFFQSHTAEAAVALVSR